MSIKESVSRFGKFLSSMVMPNIGAFIAWGFLAALFIASGWIPNEQLAQISDPMLKYLLPIMIAGQGGYITGGDRGRVAGVIAVMGCIVGSDYTMLMGAMVMGPVAGACIRRFDLWAHDHTPGGFEMLVDNFSVGIIGLLLTIVGYYAAAPVMETILVVLSAGVAVLVNHGLLPLLAVFIEPAKILFLNNAINHGILSPIGAEQAATMGRSIMYMLESNPGPGVGVLLAYCLFSRDIKAKQSAPGAVIIHFFGGIHEIYFPYVLSNPKLIVAPIAGSAAAIAWFSMTGCGLAAPASPGSIIAYLSMTPVAYILPTIVGVAISAGVSFLIAAPMLRATAPAAADEAAEGLRAQLGTAEAVVISNTEGAKIVFACDAGMGSSAMGATRFRNRIKAVRPDLTVEHSSVDTVPSDASIVVCQRILSERARSSAPQAQIVVIDNFLDDPALDSLYGALTELSHASDLMETQPAVPEPEPEPAPDLGSLAITLDSIHLGLPSVDRESAIRATGRVLVEKGCVDEAYIDAMVERDELTSVYMGMGVAIPHGTGEAKESVKETGVVVLQYPDGIEWGGEKAHLLFGIAGKGDEHLTVLSNLVNVISDEAVLEKMKVCDDPEWMLEQLS